jgi:glycosyltransferase involved in cell wall biosynthesis
MSDRLIWLLENPEQARLMGRKGRRIVEEKFSCDAQLKATEVLYGELLKQRIEINGS